MKVPSSPLEGGALQKGRWYLFVLLLGACARPQYLTPEGGATALGKVGAEECVARFKASNFCVDLKWETRPTETSFGSFVVTTTDAGILTDIETPNENGVTIPLKIELFMPSMGHGSSPVVVEKISTGLYRAKNVFFSMKGDWEIRFFRGSDEAAYALFLR